MTDLTLYKLVHYGDLCTLFTWTAPPSREAIVQVIDTAQGQVSHVLELDLVRIVKEEAIAYTLEEWFTQIGGTK